MIFYIDRSLGSLALALLGRQSLWVLFRWPNGARGFGEGSIELEGALGRTRGGGRFGELHSGRFESTRDPIDRLVVLFD